MKANIKSDLLERFAISKMIEGFEIVNIIAQSHKSILFKVIQSSTQQSFALKLYAGELADITSKQGFLKEAFVLEKLTGHSNIVSLLYAGEIDNRPFFTMPLVNQNLAEFLSKNDQMLQFDASARLILQLLRALDSLHSDGVIHLDIKPQNILVTERQTAILSDLDCAYILPSSRLYESLKQNGLSNSISGLTFEYASPELIKYVRNTSSDKDDVLSSEEVYPLPDATWDLYSVGAVFYRLLVGKHPAETIETNSIYEALPQIKNQLEPVAPPLAIDLICQLLGLTPTDDYYTAKDYLAALNGIKYQTEDFATLCIEDFGNLGSRTQLETEIDRILTESGHIPFEQVEYLHSLQSIATNSNIKQQPIKQGCNRTLNQPISMLVNERKDYLAEHNHLKDWFVWVDHILNLYNNRIVDNSIKKINSQTKLKLSRQHFQGLQKQGYIAAENDKERVDRVLGRYFYPSSKLARFTFLNSFALSIFLILIIALIMIFQPFGEVTTQSPGNTEYTGSTPLFQPDFATNKATDDEKGQGRTVVDNHQQASRQGEMQKDVLIHPLQADKFIEIDWQTIKGLNGVKVMKHEVSEQLYQFCIDAGACPPIHKRTRYSTLPNNNQSSNIEGLTSKLPRVNVSWYDVTEHFIPWLSTALDKTISLPSLVQWKEIATSYSQNDKGQLSNCQDCTSLPRTATSLISVDAISSDGNGLVHFYGNAQEWLQDCWRSDLKSIAPQDLLHSIERCDQAIVAGGSFLNQQSELHSSQYDRLLKTAASSTVSFRVIWIQK